MNKNRKLNIKKVLIAIFALVLIIGGVVAAFKFYEYYSTPESLRESKHAYDEVVPSVKSIRGKVDDVKFVVFYPNDTESETNSFVVEKAKETFELIKKKSYGSLEIKADYDESLLWDRYYFINFDVTDNNNVHYHTHVYVYDLVLEKEMKIDEFFSEEFYRCLSSEIRYQIKESNVLADYAYTLEFLEKTMKDYLHDFDFIIDDENIVFFIDNDYFPSEHMIRVVMPLVEFGGYLLVDNPYSGNGQNYVVRQYIDPNRPMLALTFDDGPVKGNTDRVIEVLENYGSKGTFFMLGSLMKRYPDLVKDVINSGNEVASHSYNHANLTKSSTDLDFQYSENQRVLDNIIKVSYTIKLLRPPYGAVNSKVKETSPYPLIMWNVDTEDWKTLDAKATYDYVLSTAGDGNIVLLHDLHSSTVDSVYDIVPALIEEGYQLVTVSDMMEIRGLDPVSGTTYSSVKP